MRPRSWLAFCPLVLAALSTSCSVRERRPAAGPTAQRVVALGRSVRGQAIQAHVFDGTAGCVLILGAIHGDEPASADLVDHLIRRLEREPEALAGRRVVLIPRANPDGLKANTRTNARGVDINRNFPAGNFRHARRHGAHPLSEPESRALYYAIARYRPSCIVSVHGALNGVDPDGGAASTALARDMANAGPLPFKDIQAHPGSLGSYGGHTLRLKMITYELDRKRAPANDPFRYFESHIASLLLAIRRS